MKPTIFIDGEAGTTGLQIRQRLASRSDLELISLTNTARKDPVKRAEAINSCDLAILCLPDDAAREAVSFIRNKKVRVLDASSAHRTQSGWIYGLPEISQDQSDAIAYASRVSNPGCYPTGSVAMLAPLVRAGLLQSDFCAVINAISGYSGAGKPLIERYEDVGHPHYTDVPHNAYALHLEHKHVSEMHVHARLQTRPIFMPAIGRYKQGILMRIPIFEKDLASGTNFTDVRKSLVEHYKGSRFISVVDEQICNSVVNLSPVELNGSNELRIYPFYNSTHNQMVLTAIYDNLGKGASGAAVQNMNLMLGLKESGNLDLRVDHLVTVSQ